VNAAFMDEIVARVLEVVGAGAPVEPAAWQLLARRYGDTGREDLGAPLAAGLAATVEAALAGAAPDEAPARLDVCAEAARVSDDPRLAGAATALARTIRRGWGAERNQWPGIGACLHAADLVDEPGLLAAVVDEMERLVARDYEPGDGFAPGALTVQLAAAAALLTGFEATGRLPYAMLADELLQVARRRWWRPDAGCFEDGDAFAANCAAARVCCRLAVLHADPAYCEAAVLPPGADYAADAGSALAAQVEAARAAPARPYSRSRSATGSRCGVNYTRI
jgi:hypothetical protein